MKSKLYDLADSMRRYTPASVSNRMDIFTSEFCLPLNNESFRWVENVSKTDVPLIVHGCDVESMVKKHVQKST